MNGGLNPDSKKAVKRRKEAKARQPEHHAAGLGDEIEAASLATSKGRAERKRSRQIDEDEARAPSPCSLRTAVFLSLPAATEGRPRAQQLLTSGLSNKILLEARKQRDEIDDEERRGGCVAVKQLPSRHVDRTPRADAPRSSFAATDPKRGRSSAGACWPPCRPRTTATRRARGGG